MSPQGTALELYEAAIKSLPIVERLQLVRLVMDDLMNNPAAWLVDESDVWSDEDLADLTRASLTYAVSLDDEVFQLWPGSF